MERRKLIVAGVGMSMLGAPFFAGGRAFGQSLSAGSEQKTISNMQRTNRTKLRVFITGSSEGLGYGAAQDLLTQGHSVVVHVRSPSRMPAVRALQDMGASVTVGDLSDPTQIRDLAHQVNAIGTMDAVIHNAGIMSGRSLLVVNVVAPYMLTALIERPKRLIYLSSSMHAGGTADMSGLDWSGRSATGSYSDSKLFITTLAMAMARRWPNIYSNAVDPGWVPTKMGGPGAPDDLTLGHVTQAWLATSDDPDALTTGGYWYHQHRRAPNPAVNDVRFQDQLLHDLASTTGVRLPV